MKRFFALALVLCMALSMMAMTAFAAPTPDPTSIGPCSLHPGKEHRRVYAINDSSVSSFQYNSTTGAYKSNVGSSVSNHYDATGSAQKTPQVGEFYYQYSTFKSYYCPELNARYNAAPKPQPKTGVEDTLPLWFGVMAVSAAAYVMTSKKKVF